MRAKFQGQKEKYKISVMAALLAGACLSTYYFHVILEIGVVFTHLFYIPIILACIWWKRKGIVVAIFLAVLLSFSHILVRIDTLPINDFFRASMFIAIAFVVAALSERIAKAQDKSEHLNTTLRAIRNVNQLIIREKDRNSILQGVCANLTETRGYHNAWIVLFDESRTLMSTAEAGLDSNFLPMVEMLKHGELMECGQKALEQTEVVVTKDPPSTCSECPMSDKYRGGGGMTVRLENGGKIYGLLVVSIPKDFTIDEEEQALLKEVAGDIAFALNSIELEDECNRADEALKESDEKYRTLVESSTDAILMMDNERRIISCNQAFLDLFGYGKNQVEGRSIRIIHQTDDSFRSFGENSYPVIEKIGSFMMEWKFVRKDGTILPVETVTSAIKLPDGSITGYVATIRDITERK